MEIVFVRSEHRRVPSVVTRGDGVRLSVPVFGPLEPMPHDLVHFAVERELGLHEGFWGSVAAGAIFDGMHVLGGRQRPHAHERSRAVLKANQRGVPFAELLVELAVRVLKGERLENAPLPLDFPLAHTRADRDALIQRMRPAVEEMHDRWRGVPLGATLTVQWPERLRRSDPLSESVRLRAEHRRLAKRHRGGRRG
ncbi:MAG TPA: hypothetical protein VJQ45_03835 [Ktedonobacterales bacterium]|nr:hypothetical protein [Ktedonobacterales bacterium]